ncbi:uncharacterized protein LOC122264946 [Penaeus japonicus]|uniref:uncharacterized protein LOC122264946 n=1 Tax=Penaeus japonicus TaxID=27405 RepID=UPI001C715475|nr:uncharacterized protein LOC122264946 [Penaeus japonicus]
MSLTGTFEYASHENYSEWLAAVGVPADIAPTNEKRTSTELLYLLQVNLSQSGNTLKGTWSMGGKSGDACVEVTASNLVQTMSLGGVKAKRVYNRK